MSGAASSLAHFARLLQTNTMSFSHQLTSVSIVSKVLLPMSRLHASTSAGSLSLSLFNGRVYQQLPSAEAFVLLPPVELA